MKSKSSLFIFGIIAGVINIIGWWVFHLMFDNDPNQMDFDQGEIIGYTAMIISFTMVFFGIKYYRDKQQDGIITFKNAFLNGLVIVLVASVIYVIGWELYYPSFKEEFATQYEAHLLAEYKAEGLSDKEISEKKAEMDQWMENYENPFIRIGITFMEIFPVGLIISLFSALILKKKPAT